VHSPQQVAVLDSNAVDAIADEEGLYDSVLEVVSQGRLRLLWTHVTVDELAAIPDEDRRARLLTIAASLAVLVPTGSSVLGFSRLDFSRFGSDDDSDGIEAFRQGRLKDTRDALVSSTARFEGAAVCTRDERMTARAVGGGLAVVRPEALPAWAASEE
jgi:rRNA-processing protein FCF1